MLVDGGTAYENIVYDREAALAADILALAVLNAGVGKNSGFIKLDATAMLLFGQGHFVRMEPFPHRAIDDLVRSVAEDVDDRIRGVEDAGFVRKILQVELVRSRDHATVSTDVNSYKSER